MYHVLVQSLPQSVAAYIRKHSLLKAGDRVGVAVSAGADSVAVLRLLLELRKEFGIVLSVVHLNHKLRGADSDADEQFVTDLARAFKLELHSESADVAGHATKKHLSLEAAARELRYEFFHQLLRDGRLNRIATAHTLDDQAETVLLRIIRGSGTRGLAGIYPQLAVDDSQFSVIRPLLGTRRKELEDYLEQLGQNWRDDRSNRDLRHTRNRIRHGILPRLERNLNPAVREALAETAEIARAEEEYWQSETAQILPTLQKQAIQWDVLQNLPLALRRRVIRSLTEAHGVRPDFCHVEEILALAPGQAAMLPKGWIALRTKNELRLDPSIEKKPADYEYALCVPGAVDVPESGSRFETVLVSGEAAAGYNRGHLLNQALLSGQLLVRNWRPGDRFQPPHTKSARKVKELLQGRHLNGVDRARWPVVISGVDLIWVRGFGAPARLWPKDGASQAVAIREVPLETPLKAR
jgi:tRNA(Ile)-lysidine synthase